VTEYLVASHPPGTAEFDELRYWRGPVWLIVNYMIAVGLRRAGEDELVRCIVDDSIALIETSGFAEYYGPITGTPCGGDSFTWTAAMVIEFFNLFETFIKEEV
jgi:glycogen debranching enzyme